MSDYPELSPPNPDATNEVKDQHEIKAYLEDLGVELADIITHLKTNFPDHRQFILTQINDEINTDGTRKYTKIKTMSITRNGLDSPEETCNIVLENKEYVGQSNWKTLAHSFQAELQLTHTDQPSRDLAGKIVCWDNLFVDKSPEPENYEDDEPISPIGNIPGFTDTHDPLSSAKMLDRAREPLEDPGGAYFKVDFNSGLSGTLVAVHRPHNYNISEQLARFADELIVLGDSGIKPETPKQEMGDDLRLDLGGGLILKVNREPLGKIGGLALIPEELTPEQRREHNAPNN